LDLKHFFCIPVKNQQTVKGERNNALMNQKRLLLLILMALPITVITAKDYNRTKPSSATLIHNPGDQWLRYASPEEAGWSSDLLSRICKDANASSVLLVYEGRVVFAYGQYFRRFKSHSMRKSLLSALYGTHVGSGQINLNSTLGELAISDKIPFTSQEKTAKVGDMLRMRSGVYLPAASESQQMKESRPKRGTYMPGSHWYYNNWDSNVLGTIFEQETGTSIFEDFYHRIAKPLQMQDYRILDGCYDYEENSDHPAYPFKMSSRDLARFGQLLLQSGSWNGEQIIPSNWVHESLKSWSQTDEYNLATGCALSYGYLWYTCDDYRGTRMFMAAGHFGQRICVFPELDIVLVIQSDTYIRHGVLDVDFVIDDIVFGARTIDSAAIPTFFPLEEPPEIQCLVLAEAEQRSYCKDYIIDNVKCNIKKLGDDLFLEGYHFCYTFRLLPISKRVFYIEDLDQYLFFEFDKDDVPVRADINKSPTANELYSLILNRGVKKAAHEFKAYQELIKSPDELCCLADKLITKGIDNIEVLKFNAMCFPGYYYVQSQLKDALVSKFDAITSAAVFEDVVKELHREGIRNSKADWFYEILDAQANPKMLDESQLVNFVGNFDGIQIGSKGSTLHYTVNNSSNTRRLYLISNNEFAVEKQFHRRFRFETDASSGSRRLVVIYYRGTSETFAKEQ